MSQKLQNYLRTYRTRAGFSQDEVAFLMGCESGTKVTRYERLARQPSLETALAYEAIFGIPARVLFAGVYQKVERKISRRAQVLARKLNGENAGRMSLMRKIKALQAIASGPESGPAMDS